MLVWFCNVHKSQHNCTWVVEKLCHGKHITYLFFFPYINKTSALCEFNEKGKVTIIYHILTPIGYLFLLLLVIHTVIGKKKKKTAKSKSVVNQIIEARSDTNMFCVNCGSKLSDGAEFCVS